MRALTGFYLVMMLLTLVGCAGQTRKPTPVERYRSNVAQCDGLPTQEQVADCEADAWVDWYAGERNY